MAGPSWHPASRRRHTRAPASLGVLGALLLVLCLLGPSPATAELPGQRCIVIDSDAALDDFRAVATLAPTGRIAAIVVTEGLARVPEGAGAMTALLARGDLSIPVIPGASPDPHRGYQTDGRLPAWRADAERLNGLLPAPLALSGAPGDLVATLRHHTRRCAGISLVMIGPWTSFVRYAGELLGRVERIVTQGRPYPDEPGGDPSGFNCVYDLDSCMAAFDLLVGRQRRAGPRFRAEWVDIPNSPEACGSAEPGIDARGDPLYAFRPTAAWLRELDQAGGMARLIADMLRANPGGWEQTSLWDDLAALYLVRRDIFVPRGGHLEPCIPAAAVRSLLAAEMARGGPR